MELATVRFSEAIKRWSRLWGDFAKRAFDIIVSAIVLVLLSPFLGLIALAIKHDTPGPAIYRGRRYGRGGKPFMILKFRTMYEKPECYRGPGITAHDDPRVTPLGKWLRNTKLNELPQFWNVLVGEMSLVGPRPEDPSIARTWPKGVWREILSVRPGITSPASVQYHNEETLLSADHVIQEYMDQLSPDKNRLDVLYVRRRNFWLDLDVLLWTVLVLLPKLSTSQVPEELLFVGPITRLIRRHVSWFTLDLFVTFSAIAFTGALWRAYEPLHVGWPLATAAAIVFALIFSVVGALRGVNRISWSKAALRDMYDLLPVWLIAFLIAFASNHLLDLFPSQLIVYASVLALGGFVLIRYRTRLVTAFLRRVMDQRAKPTRQRERVLILGSGANAQHVAWLLDRPELSNRFQLVGFADNRYSTQGMRIYGAPVLGNYADVPKLAGTDDISMIILADPAIARWDFVQIEEFCRMGSSKLVIMPDIISSLRALNQSKLAAPIFLGVDDAQNDPNCVNCLSNYMCSDEILNSALPMSDENLGNVEL